MRPTKNPRANSSQGARGVCFDDTLADTTLKTADTLYGGVLFRSRLEARWAVFFDHLHLRWQYEPEAFVLPDGTQYAPTFLIHTPQGKRRWVCVKPHNITSDPAFTAFEKAIKKPQGTRATLASGSPLEWIQAGHTFCPRCGMPYSVSEPRSFWCEPCDWETPCGSGHDPQDDGVRGITWTPCGATVDLDRETAETWSLIVEDAAQAAQRKRLDFFPIGGQR